ncbi:hypothetical protein JOE25_004729 [Serratia sp. PL17]|nr:hypothetical protein [Serratia sp. PL17]
MHQTLSEIWAVSANLFYPHLNRDPQGSRFFLAFFTLRRREINLRPSEHERLIHAKKGASKLTPL